MTRRWRRYSEADKELMWDRWQKGDSLATIPRRLRDRELQRLVRQIHLESDGVYGAGKVHRELLALGEYCGRYKVAQLMHKDGLKGCPKRRFRRRKDSHRVSTRVRLISAGYIYTPTKKLDTGYSSSYSDRPLYKNTVVERSLGHSFER